MALWVAIRNNACRSCRRVWQCYKPRQRSAGPQQMVPCAHCGLMMPKTEALEHGGKHYCSADHQRQGPA